MRNAKDSSDSFYLFLPVAVCGFLWYILLSTDWKGQITLARILLWLITLAMTLIVLVIVGTLVASAFRKLSGKGKDASPKPPAAAFEEAPSVPVAGFPKLPDVSAVHEPQKAFAGAAIVPDLPRYDSSIVRRGAAKADHGTLFFLAHGPVSKAKPRVQALTELLWESRSQAFKDLVLYRDHFDILVEEVRNGKGEPTLLQIVIGPAGTLFKDGGPEINPGAERSYLKMDNDDRAPEIIEDCVKALFAQFRPVSVSREAVTHYTWSNGKLTSVLKEWYPTLQSTAEKEALLALYTPKADTGTLFFLAEGPVLAAKEEVLAMTRKRFRTRWTNHRISPEEDAFDILVEQLPNERGELRTLQVVIGLAGTLFDHDRPIVRDMPRTCLKMDNDGAAPALIIGHLKYMFERFRPDPNSISIEIVHFYYSMGYIAAASKEEYDAWRSSAAYGAWKLDRIIDNVCRRKNSQVLLRELYDALGSSCTKAVYPKDVPAQVRQSWRLDPLTDTKIEIRYSTEKNIGVAKVILLLEVDPDEMSPMAMEATYGPFWDRGVMKKTCYYHLIQHAAWLNSADL